MKTIWENGEDDGRNGGSQTSTLVTETNARGGGGEIGSMFKSTGVTKPMMIVRQHKCNSSGSSSIGDNSDDDREEVQSRYGHDHQNGNNIFDDAIQALEQSLPIRRGISAFYNGKSKSYTCLGNVWQTTSSIHDITKPENAYTRKRRKHVAFKLSNINTRGIHKKPKTTKFQFSLETEDPGFTKHDTRSQINRPLALRSFSMVDLHQTKIGNC